MAVFFNEAKFHKDYKRSTQEIKFSYEIFSVRKITFYLFNYYNRKK